MSNLLSDEDIVNLRDFTPLSEDGGLDELAEESDVMSQAAAYPLHTLATAQQRIVFAVRAMYLLGVQRGGEEYRNFTQAAANSFPQMPFTLDKLCTEQIVDDLAEVSSGYLNRICHAFGVTFDEKGGVGLV